ncbi:Aerobic respiration control sensor protein ArcB [compost metagenome]
MGGDIQFIPTDGPGATVVFTVTLQEHRNSLQSLYDQLEPDKRSLPRSLHILVAEDHDINQIVLRKMLEKQGHTVTVVGNGLDAIQATKDTAYDMIFMDIQMPVMNGLDAAQAIKRTTSPDQCPILIAVTANALKGDKEKCLAAGMDGYISKPVKNEVLAETINTYFSIKPLPR